METVVRNQRRQSWLIILATILISLLISIGVASANNQDVYDQAGVLDSSTQRYIYDLNTDELAKLKSKPQLAVVTVKSLKGKDIDDVAQDYWDKYHFGRKGYDNGVMLLISVNDHRVRMQTGYGMESILPDQFITKIMSPDVKSAFKSGDYNSGIKQMVDTTYSQIKRHQDELPNKKAGSSNKDVGIGTEMKETNDFLMSLAIIFGILVLIMILICVMPVISDYLKERYSQKAVKRVKSLDLKEPDDCRLSYSDLLTNRMSWLDLILLMQMSDVGFGNRLRDEVARWRYDDDVVTNPAADLQTDQSSLTHTSLDDEYGVNADNVDVRPVHSDNDPHNEYSTHPRHHSYDDDYNDDSWTNPLGHSSWDNNDDWGWHDGSGTDDWGNIDSGSDDWGGSDDFGGFGGDSGGGGGDDGW